MDAAPPIWADDAPPPRWPALERDAGCDVLVIGAGLAGLGIARELSRRGADVLVLDAEGPGRGASGRNAGFLLVTHPWQYPALRARFGAACARELIAIARRSHAIVEADFGAEARHRRGGTLMLPSHEPGPLAAFDAAVSALAEDGVRTEWTAPPAGTLYRTALLVPEDGEVHPGALVAALARRVRRGAIARVDALDADARSARCGAHRVTFRRAVVAANALSGGLLPELDRAIVPQRAQVLATAPLDRIVLERPCYATEGYDYFRQLPDRRLLVGGCRHLHLEAEATDRAVPTEPVQASIERLLRTALGPLAREAAVERRWAGVMGFTPDGLPLVGPLPRAPEAISLLAGWSGHGLGLALGAAERLARALDGDAAAIPASLYPARIPTILAARAHG